MNTKPPISARFTTSLARIWQFLTGPHASVTEIGERRRAQLLATLTLLLIVSFTWAIFSNPSALTTFLEFLGITLAAYAASRTKLYRISAYFFSFSFTSIAYINLYNGTANSIDTSISSIVPISLILASAILSQRGFVLLVIVTILATGSVRSYADPKYLADPTFIYGRTIGITSSVGILLIGITAFRAGVERARLRDVQQINKELEDLTSNLEKRVAERTVELETANRQTTRRAAQLQAVTRLSESFASVQDLAELFPAVTQLISQGFGFYHVGFFLIDSDREFAILQSANSESGKQMLERGHRLKLGTGVVGYAAQTGLPRIALDVGADAVFFDNPDLPATRSEAALPIKARGETIGVLDMQSTEPGAFASEDLQVLTALANQVSIAVENARLLNETRAALAQVQEVYNEFTRAEWSRTTSKAEQTGFRYKLGRIEMIENPIATPEVVSAVASGRSVKDQTPRSQKKRSTVAVPVKLRGEVIGVLQIESSDPIKAWQDDEISLVEAVAERAAFALENARLFQDARRRASKERLISEASARLSGALNIENILQTTAQELERVLGGSEVLIRFQNKEQS
jgi:GAF domain-containing protein